MRRVLWLFACLALSCASGAENTEGADPSGGGGTGATGGGGSGGGISNPQELPPATGMAIGQVAIYQGVKVTLYSADGGDVAELNAPLVASRDALVRVFFAPKADWQPHRIAVRMTLKNGDGAPQAFEIRGTPGGASNDGDLTSSANFDIPASLLDGTLSMRVEMLDDEAGQGDTAGSAWPADGFRALGEQSTQGTFHLKVIPIRYGSGGSDLTPDLSDDVLKAIRYGFLRYYPLQSIDLQVGEEVGWSQQISPTGGGWQNLLTKIVNLRESDPAPNVYYYGLFKPDTSFYGFCGSGCVAGLTFLSGDSTDRGLRSSIGLGYADDRSINTMLHEVGHAHRREHAPCGPFGQLPDAIDPGYPYDKGSIGVWGYDLIEKKLKDPAKTSDIMSYCEPTWVSDYTFKALFNRITKLNADAAPYLINARPTRWRRAWLDVEEGLRWGDVVERALPPGGEPHAVTLGEGASARKVQGKFFPMSHLPGGLLLLPEETPLVGSVEVEGEGRYAVK